MNEEPTLLRSGTGKELPLQASKWLDLELLIDDEEMQALFSDLGAFKIFRTGAVCGKDEGEISKTTFLERYALYIDCLRQGILPDEKLYRPLFSSIFTVADDHIFQIAIADNRRILRPEKPVLQLQVNQIAYSEADGKFRSGVFGSKSILWGIHFSYPQLFQDPETKEVFSVLDNPLFPNTALFRKLQVWTRQNTVPTPFSVDQRRINVPIRLGKKCFPWINSHPLLANSNICVIIPR